MYVSNKSYNKLWTWLDLSTVVDSYVQYFLDEVITTGDDVSGVRVGLEALGIAVNNPCAGLSIGQACSGTTALFGVASYDYGKDKGGVMNIMVTPGDCTDSATPTCDGTTDSLDKQWSSAGSPAVSGNDDTRDGEGNSSLASLDATNDAVLYCTNMTYGGYSDWYLPAMGELNVIRDNAGSIGGFKTSGGPSTAGYYWNSNEFNQTSARTTDFKGSGVGIDPKSTAFLVRCVRKDRHSW